MPTKIPSEAPQATPSILTVAIAKAATKTWDDLSATRRRDLNYALNRLAGLARLPAGAVPLTVENVRRILCDSPAGMALNRSTWSNLRSLLTATMSRLGIVERLAGVLAPGWEALLARLDKEQCAGLSGLARFCSARGIEPDQVTAEVIAQLKVHFTTRTLSRNPSKQVNAIRQTWNRAARTIDDWPTGVVPSESSPNQYTLPLETFPQSFQDDLAAFTARLSWSMDRRDVFKCLARTKGSAAPARPAHALRPSSVAARRDHCRWAASALVASGMPIEKIVSLATLVELPNCETILTFLTEGRRKPRLTIAMHVAEAMRIVAKYHVGCEPPVVEQIKLYAKEVAVPYSGMTAKNERTVRAALAPAVEENLLKLPSALFTVAEELLPTSPEAAASRALRGLAIEMLQLVPLRLENLRSLRLDTHLHRADPRKKQITGILIDAHETKNGRAIAVSVPPELAAMMQNWIERFRPHIAPADCIYLFPGRGVGNHPITPQALREAIKQTTLRGLGVVVTPHQFRHLAAHRCLEDNPGAMGLVTELLGHRDANTARRSYASSQQDAATKLFDNEILAKRRRLLRRRPKTPRKGSGGKGAR